MPRLIGDYGRQSHARPQGAAQNTKNGAIFHNSRVLALILHRCTARQTSKQQGGYVIPLSWPPIQETYDAPDVGVDSEFILEVSLFDIV